MLDRWSDLRSILEEGLDWQSADKLKAVRLLGRHRIEAVDDRNVLMVFIACQAIESRTSIPIPEIWNELRKYERKQYAERLVGRGIEKLRPTDAAAARQVLFGIIDRATAQIALKVEAHRVRAKINDSLAADRLAFDDSPEAERLRRFDLACGRGLARSLDSLLKLRRAPEPVDGPSPILAGSSSAADETVQTSATPDETNKPTDAPENLTNEPTDSREIVTNEATDDGDIVTNEATAFCGFGMNEPMPAADVGLESPTYLNAPEQNATNEITGAREIVANAANSVSGFGMNEHTPSADVGLESPTYMNATGQNATSEPTLAALDDGAVDADITAGMNDGDDGDFQEEIDRQKVGERIQASSARMAALRAEKLRELNEQSHRDAKEANVGRCPWPEWHEKWQTPEGPQKRAARTKPRTAGQQM
jgi:hypothetical protein